MTSKNIMEVGTGTLEHVPLGELTQAYNLGFSDYQITHIMSEEKLLQTLRRNAYNPRSSLGLFAGKRLIGFVLNGVSLHRCYDSGTAIIPEYRGKGYARLLLKTTLTLLQDQGFDSWVLEVLFANTKAIGLYQSMGFVQSRGFNCYQIKAETIAKKSTRVKLVRQQSISIPQGECIPSWQNEEKSIRAGGVLTWDIVTEGKKVGTLCYDPQNGSIAQIYIVEKERRNGYAKETIIEAANHCTAEMLRFINIDDNYFPLNKLLLSLGFECFTTQLEMIANLQAKT